MSIFVTDGTLPRCLGDADTVEVALLSSNHDLRNGKEKFDDPPDIYYES